MNIHQRIHDAIRPQLDECDRLIWELQSPRKTIGRHTAEWFAVVPPPIRAEHIISDSITMQYWKPAWHSRMQPA